LCCQSGSDRQNETGAVKFDSTGGKFEIGGRKFDAIVLQLKTATDRLTTSTSKTKTPLSNSLSPIRKTRRRRQIRNDRQQNRFDRCQTHAWSPPPPAIDSKCETTGVDDSCAAVDHARKRFLPAAGSTRSLRLPANARWSRSKSHMVVSDSHVHR
jgi:hypothetical protein